MPLEEQELESVFISVYLWFQNSSSCFKYVSKVRRVSIKESPPNFSTNACASTNDTMASPATPPAGTTQTSERSYAAVMGCFVTMCAVLSGLRSVEIGFRYPRTT